jgi:hypothetical protein
MIGSDKIQVARYPDIAPLLAVTVTAGHDKIVEGGKSTLLDGYYVFNEQSILSRLIPTFAVLTNAA